MTLYVLIAIRRVCEEVAVVGNYPCACGARSRQVLLAAGRLLIYTADLQQAPQHTLFTCRFICC